MPATRLPEVVKEYESEILSDWIKEQLLSTALRRDLLSESEMREQSESFLKLFQKAIQGANISDDTTSDWKILYEYVNNISKLRAQQGFSPEETATFIFSLKKPIFSRFRRILESNPVGLSEELWAATTLLDKLGLKSFAQYQKTREDVISRQQNDLLELSTPVVQLWDGILALPMIGTLDSARSQIVMENLLQKIVETESEVAIIDITGVPMVDTLTAQHLLKTVTAAKLMGAECIISGIRPQIAATIVHLGIDLSKVLTKASLSDAFALALKMTHQNIASFAPSQYSKV